MSKWGGGSGKHLPTVSTTQFSFCEIGWFCVSVYVVHADVKLAPSCGLNLFCISDVHLDIQASTATTVSDSSVVKGNNDAAVTVIH